MLVLSDSDNTALYLPMLKHMESKLRSCMVTTKMKSFGLFVLKGYPDVVYFVHTHIHIHPGFSVY